MIKKQDVFETKKKKTQIIYSTLGPLYRNRIDI